MAVPRLRFKADNGSEFPEWEEKTLGELGKFIKGAPLSKADISEGGLPIILYGELYTTYKEVAYDIKNHTNVDIDKKYLSQIGDIVIPTSGETAKEISTATCVMKEGVVLAGDLYIYRISNNINGQIMSYLFNHQINNDIARIAQGKSIVHIRASELCKLVVQYPGSVCEQKKIVDFLSILDTIIKNCQSEVETWEKYKRGVMQQLFSQNVRFKADDGSEYPDWKEEALGEISKYERSDKYIVLSTEYVKSGVPVLTAGKSLVLGYTEENDGIKYADTEHPVIIFDDFTTSSHLINYSFKVKSSAMKLISGINGVSDTVFLSALLERLQFEPKDHSRKWISEFMPIVIPIPCLEEQQKIADCLSAFDEVIDKAKQKLKAYKQLKKGLLQQMFV